MEESEIVQYPPNGAEFAPADIYEELHQFPEDIIQQNQLPPGPVQTSPSF